MRRQAKEQTSKPFQSEARRCRPATATTNNPMLALLILSSAVSSAVAADGYIPWGWQSGVLPYKAPGSQNRPPEANNDDTYAGDLFYSPTTNLLYLTGGTYSGSNFDFAEAGENSQFHLPASDCYVAAIRFPSPGDDSTIDDAPGSGSSTVPDYTDSTTGSGGKDGELMFTARYGATAVPDVCSSIVPIRLGTAPTTPGAPAKATQSDHMVAIGHAEEGGLMTDLRSAGSDRATVYGYALDMEVVQYSSGNGKQLTYSPKGVQHIGGRLFHENKVQYPVAIATPPPAAKVGNGFGDKSEMYVVMLISDYDDVTNRWDPKARNPDLTAGGGGGVQQYGRGGYSIEIKKLGWKFEYGPPNAATQDRPGSGGQEVTENMVTVFTQEYATSDAKSIRVANLLYIPHVNAQGQREDFLLMSGYTRGYGWAFGSDTPGNPDDSDGFVTKLDPNTGLEMSASANMDATDMTYSNTYSMRLNTQPGKMEIIHAVCVNRNKDDVRDAYVVGSTTGLLDPDFTPPTSAKGNEVQYAFIAKLDLDTLNIEWRKQFGTAEGTDVYATGCAVTDNGAVYVGGVVTDSGVLTGDDLGIVHGEGGDDVFLIRMEEASGNVQWGRQIGTDQDERLATGGGVEIDGGENAILFGTTRGSMMRMRGDDAPDAAPGTQNPADVFVMSVSQDGDHRFPIEEVTGVGAEIGIGIGGGQNDPKFPNQPAGNQDLVKGSAANGSNEPLQSGASKFLIAIIGLASAVVLVFFAYKVGDRRANSSNSKRNDHRHITQYIKDFDEIDVAIRPSATGGWHGMYDHGGTGASELGASPPKIPAEVSFGLGSGETSGETASLGKESMSSGSGSASGSDIVKESLFFDEEEESKPKKRESDGLFQIDDDEDGDEDGEGKKWGAGYAGLVESYNESWKERSPQNLGMGGFGKDGLPADSAPRISGKNEKPTDAEIV